MAPSIRTLVFPTVEGNRPPMLIATRFPLRATPSSAVPSTRRRELAAESLAALLGTVLFHAGESLDDLDRTDAAVTELLDRIGGDVVEITLDLAGGVAVVEVVTVSGPPATGARRVRTDSPVGPARRTVAEQITGYLHSVGASDVPPTLRLVVDAP